MSNFNETIIPNDTRGNEAMIKLVLELIKVKGMSFERYKLMFLSDASNNTGTRQLVELAFVAAERHRPKLLPMKGGHLCRQ